MKFCVKKIYCPNCHRLVRGYEQTTNGSIHVSCSRCGNLIWVWDGITWRYVAQRAK